MTQEMNPLTSLPEEYIAVTQDGRLKKKVLRAGTGAKPTHKSKVTGN